MAPGHVSSSAPGAPVVQAASGAPAGAGPRSRLRAEGAATSTAAAQIAAAVGTNVDRPASSSGGGTGGQATSKQATASKAGEDSVGDAAEHHGDGLSKKDVAAHGEEGGAGALDGAGGSQPSKPPKPPRKPLEALDPESSSSDESDDSELPPEYAVLDLTVPRTALVINVAHVLKRLNGCCSLNQLTKSLKSFKEKTGVTLEAFLRANPMTFKLEGRIVYYVDRDGNKWKPPQQDPNSDAVPYGGSRGKGKGRGGKGDASYGQAGQQQPSKKKRGGGAKKEENWNEQGSYSWGDGWSAGAWNATDWNASGWKVDGRGRSKW